MEDAETNETIFCPTIFRNTKPFHHKEAKLMGKYSHPEEDYPEDFTPDYCFGFLYVTSPKAALAIAEAAKIMGSAARPDILEDDEIISGFLAERIPWIKHRSLTPLGGSLWDRFFSHCPLLGLLRVTFNPLALGAGSKDSKLPYINSPRFPLCVIAETFMYDYLKPIGITWDIIGESCSR